MQLVVIPPWVKLESVSLVTTKITVISVIPESGLVQEEDMMTPTRAEMKGNMHTSKPWVTS